MSVDLSPEQERGLIQRLKRRDPDAMLDVYDSYSRLLFSIVLRAIGNSAVAEDITQEVFLRVWNRIQTFDEQRGNFEGWLVTVARNRAFDYLRSVRNAPDSSPVSLTDLERMSLSSTGEGGPGNRAATDAVRQALGGLNHDQREVIELTHFEGMTQTEIAGRLKKPLGTVKGLVRSALKSLRSTLVAAGAFPDGLRSQKIDTSQGCVMTCDRFEDDLELYALGALESEPAAALAEHLATGCPTCQQALQRALHQSRLVSSTVPLVDPPARLRRRVHDAIGPAAVPKRQWLPWVIAAAALLALAVGFTLQNRSRQSANLVAQADQARVSAMLQILGAPGTQEVPFTDPKVPDLHGAVYVHQKLGLAVIIDRLPTAPSGWKYESWVVPKSGAPQPVEPFHPDGSGRALSIVPGPVDVANVDAVAVSMEPENSQPTKPTTLVFAAKI